MVRRSGTLLLLLVMNSLAADQILVHGHRGARAQRPENTLPAFEYAISVGVDVLELDVAITKDNIPVVSHDPKINGTICTGPKIGVAIHDLTLAELREHDCGAKKNPLFATQQPVPGTNIPTLDEVFALASKGTFDFNVETKIFPDRPELTVGPDAFAQTLLAAIRKHKLEKRVIVQSFDFRTLLIMEKLAPEIRRSALYDKKPSDPVQLGRDAHANIISPKSNLIGAEEVEACRKAGFQIVPWTANQPEEWERLAGFKVDAIISDDPAGLLKYLRERDLHR